MTGKAIPKQEYLVSNQTTFLLNSTMGRIDAGLDNMTTHMNMSMNSSFAVYATDRTHRQKKPAREFKETPIYKATRGLEDIYLKLYEEKSKL